MNEITKMLILIYASDPKNEINFFGDYEGKRYFVSLEEERVEFVGLIEDDVNAK